MYRYDPFGLRILRTLTLQGADNANAVRAKLLPPGSHTANVNAGSPFFGYTDKGFVAEYASLNSPINANNGDVLAAYGYFPNQTWHVRATTILTSVPRNGRPRSGAEDGRTTELRARSFLVSINRWMMRQDPRSPAH